MAIAAPPPSHAPYGLIVSGRYSIATTAPASLAASGTKTLFTIAGTGGIIVQAVWGVVTTVIQTQACTLKLSAKVGTLTAVDICAASASISALAVGTVLMPVTSFATALPVTPTNGVVVTNAGAAGAGVPTGFIMAGAGIITQTTSATNTGAIQWYMLYSPVLNANPVNTAANQPTSEVTPCNA